MGKPTDLVFSPGLTNIAVKHQNKELIGDHVLPLTQHSSKTGKYKIFSQYEIFGVEGGLIGDTGHADEIGFGVSEADFTLADNGLKGYVSQQQIDLADAPIKPLETMTRTVTNGVLLRRERRIALAVLNTNNYHANNKNDEAGSWANVATDVWGRFLAGMDACAARPNVLVLDLATFRAIQKNTSILSAIKGTLQPQFIEQAVGPAKTGSAFIPDSVFCPALAAALGVDRVVIGAAQFATSKKGQALTKGKVWDLPNATKGGAAFLRVAQEQVEDLVWGLHLAWKEPLRVMTWFEPDRGADGSTGIKVVETTKIVLVDNTAGYLYQDTLVT